MTWIELAIILSGWGIGNSIFYKFEKHLPWHRRLLKLLILLGMLFLVGLIGRLWIYIVLGVMTIGMIVLHGYWFPKNGINGITAEPYDKYLELIKRMKIHHNKDA